MTQRPIIGSTANATKDGTTCFIASANQMVDKKKKKKGNILVFKATTMVKTINITQWTIVTGNTVT